MAWLLYLHGYLMMGLGVSHLNASILKFYDIYDGLVKLERWEVLCVVKSAEETPKD